MSMVAGFAILILYGLRAKELFANDRIEAMNVCRIEDCSAFESNLTFD